jgi:hypothetical protein
MSFSDLTAGIDASTREHLCDPVELRPAGGGSAIAPLWVMIDEPLEPAGMGIGAPILQAEIQVATADHVVRVGDVAITGQMVAGVFVASSPVRAWRVAGAPVRDVSGRWQTAAIERFAPAP